MVGQDYIDLRSLTLEELTGVVNLYPWFGAARKELCVRMARQGGNAWGLDQYGREALYIADRRKVSDLVRAGAGEDCSDQDVHELLRSLLVSETAVSGEEQRTVKVVGGDYFSQAQYDHVREEGDGIFSRFAAKVTASESDDAREGSDIADRFATETLAEIFAEQGCVDEARRIYSRLMLDNPEKSAYFASLIDKLN